MGFDIASLMSVANPAPAPAGSSAPPPAPSQTMGPVNNRQSSRVGDTSQNISITPGLGMMGYVIGGILLVAFILWLFWR